MSPRVSVVMSVRNGMPYLPEAVESIINQTLSDFELIIMDNNSSDGSQEWVEALKDTRVRLVRNEKDLGLSGSLNKGFALARGEYIARMDADDISLPERLAIQVEYMDAHQDVVICGGEVEVFDNQTSWLWGVPHGQDEMLATLIFEVPIIHPTAIYRTKAWQDLSLQYDESLKIAQDYDMWRHIGLVHGLLMDNVTEPVLRYRWQGQNLCMSETPRLLEEVNILRKRILSNILRDSPSLKDQAMYEWCGHGTVNTTEEMVTCAEWLCSFKKVVITRNLAEHSAIERAFGTRWKKVCNNVSCVPVLWFVVISAFNKKIDSHFVAIAGGRVVQLVKRKLKRILILQ